MKHDALSTEELLEAAKSVQNVIKRVDPKRLEDGSADALMKLWVALHSRYCLRRSEEIKRAIQDI